MTVLKCKVCGGQIVVDAQHSVAVCEYCGVKQSLPMFFDNSAQLLYDRGNHYLQNNEYDKAENVFNQLITINPDKSELYWNLILCKYGVTYVCDPTTGKYIPTCNRTHYQSVFNDENYQKALKLASPEKAALYKSDAKTVDNIQKGILTVSKKEKPFDIFISYKETDANGNRTKDSLVAQSLYEKLTEAGYKVFFSRITLEDKIGTEYEPYIYAALYSSKVMLAIGSCKENFEAVWVKNEWSRFLNLRQNDASKTLIPLYFYMSQYELPKEFSILQPQDMDTEQFDKELLRGIKKLIPLPVMLAEKRKKVKKVITAVVATLCAAAVAVGVMFVPQIIQNQKYGKQYKVAEQLYYDGNYPEATWAFAEIGDYKAAAEMKEKAELSWRKSLATVVDTDWNGGYGEAYQDKKGVYYVNKNGTIDTVENLVGEAHKNIDISKHGNVISIAAGTDAKGNEALYALHADGYVSNAKENNQLEDDSEWYDIVKISPATWNGTNFALRSDGKIVCGTGYGIDQSIVPEISKWEFIVDFKASLYGDTIIGLKSDGTLCGSSSIVVGDYPDYKQDSTSNELNMILVKFKNVMDFEFSFSDGICIAALTSDGKIQRYQDGEFIEESASGICDIISNRYVLKSNGEVIDLATGDTVLKDVVNVSNNNRLFPISKAGTIYTRSDDYANDVDTKTNSKAIVYDEWLERLD